MILSDAGNGMLQSHVGAVRSRLAACVHVRRGNRPLRLLRFGYRAAVRSTSFSFTFSFGAEVGQSRASSRTGLTSEVWLPRPHLCFVSKQMPPIRGLHGVRLLEVSVKLALGVG